MKKALLLILTFFASSAVFAQTFTYNGINYKVTSPTTVEVGLNPNFVGAAVIPSSITNASIKYEVTSIGNDAFFYNLGLTSVVIPNSVKFIGSGAFNICANLSFITIPSSVIYIGVSAFSNCTRLAHLKVAWSNPLNIIDIFGSNPFDYTYIKNVKLYVPAACLEKYSLAPIWKDFGTITEEMIPLNFTYSGINYNVTSPTTVEVANNINLNGDVIIPSLVSNFNSTYTVTSLGYQAFFECTGLTSITIPTTVSSIRQSALVNCQSLKSLKIPNSVTSIDGFAIAYLGNITNINIPNSVTSIGSSSFYAWVALKSVTVNWVIPLLINSYVFDGCPISTATLYVPAGTLAAYKSAPVWKDFGTIIESPPITFTYQGINFKVTSSTTIEITATPTFTGALTIPSSITYEGITYDVTSIANNAFAGSGITTINIPSTVINIGDYAFANLTGLTTVTVNWTTPLVINANVFGDVPINNTIGFTPTKRTLMANKVTTAASGNTNIANATLYVPAGTETFYISAPVWKDFGTITASTLPLTLTSLTAEAISTGNQINWATAGVINVKNITLERSGADNIFSPLVVLPVTAVQYIDNNPLPGDNYYRLSSTDNDGTTQTYPLTAFVKGLSNEVSFYPNPVTNGILNVVGGSYKIESVALFDLNGKKVVFVKTKSIPQNLAISTQSLAKGVYVLEIKGENDSTTKKVVVD